MYSLHFESDCKCILSINTDVIISLEDTLHELKQLKQLSGRQVIQGVERTMNFISAVYHRDSSNKYKGQDLYLTIAQIALKILALKSMAMMFRTGHSSFKTSD